MCYISEADGEDKEYSRCATERVEGVTSTDILYDSFHKRTMATMAASDGRKSCGQTYVCPNGEPDCQTRYVIF